MKIILPLLGKTKEAYLAAGIEDFACRLRRFVPLAMPVLKEKKAAPKDDPIRLKNEEGRALLAAVPPGATMVALDPAGSEYSSPELAGLLERLEGQGVRELAFLIGGPTGLSTELLQKASLTLSLSKMTFTHEMARLLLLEQLYRAWSIRNGTGYHK